MSVGCTAYIGVGSNLGGPAEQVERGISSLERIPCCELVARSRLYRNPPMGPQDQPEYVNAVAALETTLTPDALLEALQAIETRQGRVASDVHWGPRVIDLDLLLYGKEIIEAGHLHVPHPGIAARAFVLVPLAEIAPGLELPALGPVTELLQAVDGKALLPLECTP